MIKPALIITALTVIVLTVLSIRYDQFANKRRYGDFHVYYETGRQVLAGQPIYRDTTEKGVTPFKYSPLVASVFAALSILPERQSAVLWHLINLFFLIAVATLSFQLADRAFFPHFSCVLRYRVTIIALSVLALSGPLLNCLNSGQVGLAIAACFMAGIYFDVQQGRVKLSAFFFALSAMFKFLPLIIVPILFFSGRVRHAFWVAFWFVVLLVVPALWFGWGRAFSDIAQFVPFLTQTSIDHVSMLDVKNQSVWAYLYRLFFYECRMTSLNVDPKPILLSGTALFIFFIVVLLSIRRQRIIQYALAAILIVVFNPNAWKHNFVLLLFPFTIVVLRIFADVPKQRAKNMVTPLLVTFLFLISNRTLFGWDLRFELLSMSILLCAALVLFADLTMNAGRMQK